MTRLISHQRAGRIARANISELCRVVGTTRWHYRTFNPWIQMWQDGAYREFRDAQTERITTINGLIDRLVTLDASLSDADAYRAADNVK
jgi:hypothetical protein